MDLFKAPGIAETLDWAEALIALDRIALDPQTVADTLGVLLKYQDDVGAIAPEVAARTRRRSAGRRASSCELPSARHAPPLPRGRLAENVLHFVRVLRARRAAGRPGEGDRRDRRRRSGRRRPTAPTSARRWPPCSCRGTSTCRCSSRRSTCSGRIRSCSRRWWRRCCRGCYAPHRRGRSSRPSCPRGSRRRCCRRSRPTGAHDERRGRARRRAHVLGARDPAEEGLRDDDRGRARAGARRCSRGSSCRCPSGRSGARAPAPRGARIDLRATLRGMTGAAGAVAPLAFRARVGASRRRWSCCATSPDRWTATRGCCCTSCTRSPTTAIACTRWCSARASPTSRGTCSIATSTSRSRAWRRRSTIGPAARASARASREFNRRWSRRLLGQNAVVLLISDGLDAEAGAGLAFEVERAAQVVRAPGLAQSAAALCRVRGAARGHPRDAALRRRLPAGAQHRVAARRLGGARPAPPRHSARSNVT